MLLKIPSKIEVKISKNKKIKKPRIKLSNKTQLLRMWYLNKKD